MEQAHLHSRSGKRESMSDIRDRYAMLRRLHLIHANLEPRLRVFNVPVGIHNTWGVLENRFDLLGNLRLTIEIGAVDLGHQGLYNRWPWRNLADLNARAILVANRIEQRAKPFGDHMALGA